MATVSAACQSEVVQEPWIVNGDMAWRPGVRGKSLV